MSETSIKSTLRSKLQIEQSSDEGKHRLDLLLWDIVLIETATVCAEHATDHFVDLLHQCPALLDTLRRLSLRSLSALLGTSYGVRDQVSAVLQYMYMVRSLAVNNSRGL